MRGNEHLYPNRPHDDGFTLIELLVGVALTALIGVLLVQSMRSARQGLAFNERAAGIGHTFAAQAYLRSALRQAQPLTAGSNDGRSNLGFRGSRRSMTFLTSYVPRSAYAGLYWVEVAIERSENRDSALDLVVRHRLYRPQGGEDEPVWSARSILADDIRDAEFEYFAKSGDSGNDNSGWLENWTHGTHLPVLIAVEVSFRPGDSRVWPRLNVPIYAAATTRVVCAPRQPCR